MHDRMVIETDRKLVTAKTLNRQTPKCQILKPAKMLLKMETTGLSPWD